jgi:hypothetical protein
MNALASFAAQGRFVFEEGTRWLGELDDSHLALEPIAGLKTAGWLVGHLSVTGDFGRRLCGLPSVCPREWRLLFNPGTFPSRDRDAYPPMSQLRDTIVSVYMGLFADAPSAPVDVLARPNPYRRAIDTFPTAGDFAAYLMTGHLAHHLAQLGAWRAAALGVTDTLP